MKPTKVCNVAGCPELVFNGSGMCPHHRQQARRKHDRRVGRVRGAKWAVQRQRVLKADPWCACPGCGHHEGRCREFATEIDHILPLREGGQPLALDNLQGLCHDCHLDKTRGEQRRFSNGGEHGRQRSSADEERWG